MLALNLAVVVAALTTGINGAAAEPKFIGTFDTFTDDQCSQGGAGFTVTETSSSGTLKADVKSVRGYFKDCAFVVWVHGGRWYPLVIRPGNSQCMKLDGRGREWNVSC